MLPDLEAKNYGPCARPARLGASGDAPEYRLEQEYEDDAAVVDAVAAAAGEHGDVYGHSHGGIVAVGAATLTVNIRNLVPYEGWPVPDPSICALPADGVTRMDSCARCSMPSTEAPSLDIDTFDGWHSDLDKIAAFCRDEGSACVPLDVQLVTQVPRGKRSGERSAYTGSKSGLVQRLTCQSRSPNPRSRDQG